VYDRFLRRSCDWLLFHLLCFRGIDLCWFALLVLDAFAFEEDDDEELSETLMPMLLGSVGCGVGFDVLHCGFSFAQHSDETARAKTK